MLPLSIDPLSADEEQELAKIWGERMMTVLRRGDLIYKEAQIAKTVGNLERYKRCEKLMKRTIVEMDKAVAESNLKPEVLSYYVSNVMDKRPREAFQ